MADIILPAVMIIAFIFIAAFLAGMGFQEHREKKVKDCTKKSIRGMHGD